MPSTMLDLDVEQAIAGGPSATCSTCGRPLRHPDSVRRRRGPKCQTRYAHTIPAGAYEYRPPLDDAAAPQLPLGE